MADPRFYDNRGPLSLADICRAAGADVPGYADGRAAVYDVAHLAGAAPEHVTFYLGGKSDGAFTATHAGFCFVPAGEKLHDTPPEKTVLVPCASVHHAFAAAARTFYPDYNLMVAPQTGAVDPSAVVGEGVLLSPGVVIGPGAEIGAGTRIGANAVIGRGVSIGKNCEIGSNVSITHAYLGDNVVILPGAQIGQPGFGFAGSRDGLTKIPQLGRVIIQNGVEIGAGTAIDRGALGDTVIGEGTKIDNLVQIGHSARIGRHCIIVSQCGISGSCELGDGVTLGGQVGLADHCRIGDAARLAGRTALTTGQAIEGGHDYAGVPAKPLRDWIREVYAVAALIKKPK